MTTSVLTWGIEAESPAQPLVEAPPRDHAFDSLRLVASIAIVWAHTPRCPELLWLTPLGSFGTSFFTGASIYFMTQGLKRDPQRSFRAYAETRFRKLYLPFMAWSVVYLIFRDLSRHFVSREPLVGVGPMTFISGGQMHLWFLPFILISSLAAFPIVRMALASGARARLISCACALTGLTLTLLPTPAFAPEVDTTNFYRCAWFALPAVLWGIAVALSDELVAWLRSRAPLSTLIAVVIAALSVTAGVRHGVMVWEKNLAGTAWLLAALSIPRGRWHGVLGRWAPLAFGLYLVHPLVLGMLRAAMQVARVPQAPWLDVTYFPLAVVLGVAVAWCMRQNRSLRWLVP
jgi:surface polysaccharide O-acyltransferase-like enzyme